MQLTTSWVIRDLEMWIRSRSLKMVLFDRPYTTFSWSAIVTIAVSCTFYSNYGTILYRLQDIVSHWSKIATFLYPTCIQHLQKGWPHRNFAKMFDTSSSSHMRVLNHDWSAMKQRPHPQSVAEISRHSVLSGDRIQQCETLSGSRHKDTDQCL